MKLKLCFLVFSFFLSTFLSSAEKAIPENCNKKISSNYSEYTRDSLFAKIYSTLSLTGNLQPSGDGDIKDVDEGFTNMLRLSWDLNELTTDELICSWGDTGIPELNFNKWTDVNVYINGIYERLYFNISLCNKFINLTKELSDDKSLKQIAEVRFLRVFNYWYLLDFFGNVPLITSDEDKTAMQISRKELFEWIVEELKSCEPNMFEPRESPYYRVDKAAAWILLSRLYINFEIYTGQLSDTTNWNNAAFYSSRVINSGYVLNPSYKQLFMADNAGQIDSSTVNTAPQEIIFPIFCDGKKATSWGNSLYLIASTYKTDMLSKGLSEAWAGNRVRSSLVKKFFPGTINVSDLSDLTTGATSPISRYTKDERALFNGANGRTLEIAIPAKFMEGYSSAKWTNIRADGKVTTDSRFTDTDVPLMRVAEAYLTYAEAVLRGADEINNLSPLNAVNAVRNRAKAKILTIVDLNTIIDERAREFHLEGFRRTDLIRFEKYSENNYIWPWKGGVESGSGFEDFRSIFPIPREQLIKNPNLVQNFGYGISALRDDLFKNKCCIYPNPTSENIEINGTESNYVIEIFDLEGKKVVEREVKNHEMISLKTLNSGLYIYKIIGSEQIENGKILKH